MLPRPDSTKSACQRVWHTAAWLLGCLVLSASVLADPPTISQDRIFQPVDFNQFEPIPGGPNDGAPLAGQPYQDFTVQPPLRTFPSCRLPLLSWRLGPGPECGQYGPNVAPVLPAHAVRMADWYVSADVVGLRRDPGDHLTFAQAGALGAGVVALNTSNFNIPLDAGGQFMIGHKFTERLSFETTYLGSFEWNSAAAIRNNLTNVPLGGTTTGVLASPFTQFGLLGQQAGLDFNNFVSATQTANLESLDLSFRYRPDMPYGAYDVSFLYGIRYLHTDELLGYHSESLEPAPGGSINNLSTAVGNDLLGFQCGLTSHILVVPAYWIDWDVKGGIYNNHARQRSVYQNTDSNGAFTSFANSGGRDDTAYSLDLRVIGNFQILPRLTLRAGYQATFLESMATGVSNFQSNLDIIRFGPAFIDTSDRVVYHGPVLGLTWVR